MKIELQESTTRGTGKPLFIVVPETELEAQLIREMIPDPDTQMQWLVAHPLPSNRVVFVLKDALAD